MERFYEKLPSDRRLARRHGVQTPLRVRMRGVELREQKLESENLSQRGICFVSDLRLSKDATVDVLVEMPESLTGVPTAQWLCTGHLVGREPTASEKGQCGLTVQFDFYEVSRFDRPGWPVRVGTRGPVAPVAEVPMNLKVL